MDNSNSIVEFFYNIVPGSLFLFFMHYFGFDFFKSLGLRNDPVLIVFGYIVLGLFLGFLFQGITKIVRDKGWNEEIAHKVATKEENRELELFERSYKKIHDNNFDISKKCTPTFYLMDNCLRGEKAAFLPTHFSSRFAFWSNIFFASLLVMFLVFVYYFFVCPCFPSEKIPGLIILLAIIPLSKNLADRHFEGFYDSILKSYFMLVVKKQHPSS